MSLTRSQRNSFSMPELSGAAIIGVGQTALTRSGDQTSLALQAQAAKAALADAGLELGAVDGLLTTPLGTDSWMMPVAVTANYLSLKPQSFATVDLAGASGCAMIAQACQAIAFGRCETVLCVAGSSLFGFGKGTDVVRHMAETGTAHPQFELPYGPTLVSLYALLAQRYFHEAKAGPEDLAAAAVAMRTNAARNADAPLRKPISIDDVLASPQISSPLHMLDCSMVCDGAVAVVVTKAQNASGKAHCRPVAYGQALGQTYVSESAASARTAARLSGQQAFASAGKRPSDMSFAQLYDCFTIALVLTLEDLGLCGDGQGGAFCRDGALDLEGALPTNTHGGLLSGGHPGLAGGFLHVAEAARQLMGSAPTERQLRAPECGFVHGNGGVAGIHASLILEAA